MTNRRRRLLVAAACLALAAMPGVARAQQNTQKDQKENPRPRIILRAQPLVAIAPARVVLTAELVGGANDFEEYYCPTISWDWGDDTTSESTVDCEPYEAGKSEIRRRFTVEHVFRQEGSQKVFFRLKRRNKEVGTASVTVAVRPGASPFE
jgi:hypothetical protein